MRTAKTEEELRIGFELALLYTVGRETDFQELLFSVHTYFALLMKLVAAELITPEAHYLCAIINSTLVRDFIKSYSSAGRGFGAPSVMNHVGIPKFDPKNELHSQLTEISKNLHDLKAKDEEDKIRELEKQNNELIIGLFK